MKLIKQKDRFQVENHDYCQPSAKFNRHSRLLGAESKRGIIVGGSGKGKTNTLISLLLHPNGLRFENIYVYSKSLHQPKYQFLKKVLDAIKGVGYYEYEDGQNIVRPSEAKPYSIMIFDDVVCGNQCIIRDFYCFGRHYNIDCFYLCQTYSSIPKQLIRDNANFILIFPQDVTNLKHIYNDHVNVDMSFDHFLQMCSKCWETPFGFLVIDKESDITRGRYRKGFDQFISV